MDNGNFRIRSFKCGGGGVIIVERINKKYVKENAHMYATGYRQRVNDLVFRAANGGFLTINGERIILDNS